MKKWIGMLLILVVTGILIGMVVIPAIAQGGEAQIPQTIGYQGFLTDTGGNPINDSLPIVFSIYSGTSGGTALWSETHPSVKISNGLFSMMLGSSGTPINISHLDGERYLGIKVDTDAEMSPRQMISSVAYSLRAEAANTATALNAPDGSPEDAVIVDNSGNIGIGTNSPVEELHVQGTGPVFIRSEVTNDNAAGIQFQASSVGDETGGINQYAMFIYGNDNSGDLRINEDYIGGAWSPTTRFLLQNDTGNVGIGTTTPIAPLSFANGFGDKVTIWGQTPGGPCLGLGNRSQEFQIHTDASYADMVFGWGTSGTLMETARITGTGYLGVGDFSGGDPAVELHVKDSSQIGADSDSVLRLQSNGGNNDSIIEFYENTAQAMSMHYDGGANELRLMDLTTGTPAPRVTFERSGRVGIGTDSPGNRLHLILPGREGMKLQGDDTGDTYFEIDNGGGLHFLFDDDSQDHKLTLESAPGRHLAFNTNGVNERMRITSAGNVGIGTGSPTSKLDVEGDISSNNMPGCEFTSPASYADIPASWSKVDSIELSLESAGYVIVTFYGSVNIDNSGADVFVGIGDSSTTADSQLRCQSANIGDYIPFSVQHVYQVPSSGTYLYYGNAYSSTGFEDIEYAEITAIYVPNRY